VIGGGGMFRGPGRRIQRNSFRRAPASGGVRTPFSVTMADT
jgi:hypothetical protein